LVTGLEGLEIVVQELVSSGSRVAHGVPLEQGRVAVLELSEHFRRAIQELEVQIGLALEGHPRQVDPTRLSNDQDARVVDDAGLDTEGQRRVHWAQPEAILGVSDHLPELSPAVGSRGCSDQLEVVSRGDILENRDTGDIDIAERHVGHDVHEQQALMGLQLRDAPSQVERAEGGAGRQCEEQEDGRQKRGVAERPGAGPTTRRSDARSGHRGVRRPGPGVPVSSVHGSSPPDRAQRFARTARP